MTDPSGIAESSRDRHLFGPGPKRILALDGGGVRGATSVAFLERIETLLSEAEGREVRLGDYFDLIGGTSTGAVIAGALALGYRTRDIRSFYLELAPRVFKRPFWRVPWLQSKFDSEALVTEIGRVVGARTLDSADLITGLCLVTKRVDTGSPWILANNPRAPYWETPADQSFVGNRHYRLANLVRASTAAPSYFDPEPIPILEGQPHGLFVDGGVTPHNNPALVLFQIATLKAFRLCWPTGPDRLSIVSVGTGGYRRRLSRRDLGFFSSVKLAIHALRSLMDDGENLVLALMQWMGECPAPWPINSEVGTLAGEAPGGPLFRFMRYDIHLEPDWLANHIGVKLPPREITRLREMDDAGMIHLAYQLGQKAAEKQIRPEHFCLSERR